MENENKEMFAQLSLNISYYRRKQGLTQMQLAELLNISRTHMSNIEALNMERAPSLDLLFSIAKVLDVEVSKLFETR